jgi:hypothetical protein
MVSTPRIESGGEFCEYVREMENYLEADRESTLVL